MSLKFLKSTRFDTNHGDIWQVEDPKIENRIFVVKIKKKTKTFIYTHTPQKRIENFEIKISFVKIIKLWQVENCK